MTLFVVDVESDGPCPALYSMVSFGCVRVDRDMKTMFYGLTKPISDKWVPEALAISDTSRETHLTYPDPKETMFKFSQWVKVNTIGRPIFVSDNNGFDWQFINYYFHAFAGDNPFGFSSRRIGDVYSGLVKDMYAANKWKSLRKTKHTHNPCDDALGNVEALITMLDKHNVKVPT